MVPFRHNLKLKKIKKNLKVICLKFEENQNPVIFSIVMKWVKSFLCISLLVCIPQLYNHLKNHYKN